MKSSEQNNSLKQKIVSAAYGDANLIDKIYIYWLARKNESVKAELSDYKRIANVVHKLEEECPAELLNNLRSVPFKEARNSLLIDFISIIVNKPLASAIAVLSLVVFITLSVILRQPIKPSYTDNELRKASEQANYAFRLIGNILNETTEKLEKEILREHVVKPINEGIEIANKLLIKGEK